MRRRRALYLLVLAALPACARELAPPTATRAEVQMRASADASHAFDALFAAYQRTLEVSARLRIANVGRCGTATGSYLGWSVFAERDFGSREMRDLAAQIVHVGKRPVVVALSASAPAALAGVRVGDEVVSIGGKRVLTRPQVARAESKLRREGGQLTLVRDGQERTLAVTPLTACELTAVPSGVPGLEPRQRRGHVFVPLGLVELASDDELAFSIAHAMARDLQGVDDASLAGPVPEPETTRLAAELCTRAGFSLDGVERILERRAVEEPWAIITVRGDVVLGEVPRRLAALRGLRQVSPLGAD